MTDRAVSATLNYTLVLGISAILIVGLLTAGGGFVESQRNSVVDSELSVIGERLAGDIATADRLVQSGGTASTVNLTSQLPQYVSGQRYTVAIRSSGGNASVVLSSDSLDRSIVTPVANTTSIQNTTVNGGTLEIYYDPTPGELVVRDV